jgi:3-oxoadipate enol-lactonase
VKAALYDNSYQKEARKAFHIRDTYIKSAKAPIGINYYSFLPFIKKPVLLIGSTHDKVTPSINIYLMKLFIRDARLSIFRNTGHLSNIEKKDLFNKHLHDFIMTTA